MRELLFATGRWLRDNAVPILFSGTLVGIYGRGQFLMMRDITEAKLAGDVEREQELIKTRDALQAHFENFISTLRTVRRVRRRGVTRKQRLRIFALDNYTCQYCGDTGVPLQCEHVHPWSREGLDDDDNLIAACGRCNRSKYNKTFKEWMCHLRDTGQLELLYKIARFQYNRQGRVQLIEVVK